MTLELHPVVRALGAHRIRMGGEAVHVVANTDQAIFAARLGVGPTVARVATHRLLKAVEPDHLIVCGIAGGLDPALRIGSVVVPETVIDLGSGTEHRPATPPGYHPAGLLATNNELIADQVHLDALTRRGVVAVDMESAAVGAVCEAEGCAWSVFRAVSDRPEDGTLDDAVLGLLRSDGSANGLAALRLVVSQPARLPLLVRFGRDSMLAAKRAAQAAVGAFGRAK